jgi:hypothetical protein
MLKRLFAPALILVLLLVVPVSSAYLEVTPEEDEKTVYLGDEVSFDLTVTNNNPLPANLEIQVIGDPEEWVSAYPAFLRVPGSGTDTEFSVELFPTGEVSGIFDYTVSIVPITPKSLTSAPLEELTLNVIRPLDIEEFAASKSGDDIFLSILMSSKDQRDAELYFTVLNNRGETLKVFSLEAVVDGDTLIEESEPLPAGILAGDYNVQATLVGTPVRKEAMFTVPPIHKVTEAVKKTSSTLYDEFEVTIVNEGNVEEPVYTTYRTLPNNDWMTGLITEPDECVIRNGEKNCRYVFEGLAVGEERTFSYRLDYTSFYATYVLVIVVILLLVVFGMRRATAPVIVKRHVRKAGGRHHVVLEIRNPFYHNLSNAIVRDWVTPLANVLHHEIDVLKPLVRRSDAGTELIWKLGDIRPRETRIITYPLKALVSGSLKMPKAYIRYNKPNGKLKRLFSKNLIINT